MKYFVEFPLSSGQYSGIHWFESIASRSAFVKRAMKRGIDLTGMLIGKTK